MNLNRTSDSTTESVVASWLSQARIGPYAIGAWYHCFPTMAANGSPSGKSRGVVRYGL